MHAERHICYQSRGPGTRTQPTMDASAHGRRREWYAAAHNVYTIQRLPYRTATRIHTLARVLAHVSLRHTWRSRMSRLVERDFVVETRRST